MIFSSEDVVLKRFDNVSAHTLNRKGHRRETLEKSAAGSTPEVRVLTQAQVFSLCYC
jgi:hypothetical protein